MGVAGVLRQDRPTRCRPEQRVQRRAARQPVVDHRPLGPHTPSVRPGGPARCRVRPDRVACHPRRSAPIVAMYQLDTSGGTTREVRQVAKRSDVLELAVLGLLHESPMHGYELRKRLNATFGAFRAFSYGSLYPCLKELLADGLVAEHGRAAATRRPASGRGSSTSSPPRARSTSPTCSPRAGPSAWEDESFGVHFAFFGRTDAETRLRILEGRRSRLEERRRRLPRRADPHPRAARQLHPRAAAARARVGRARGALAQRADRRRAEAPRVHRRPGQRARSQQRCRGRRPTPAPHRTPRRSTAWVPFVSPSSASATAPRRWSRASSTTRTPTRRAASPA